MAFYDAIEIDVTGIELSDGTYIDSGSNSVFTGEGVDLSGLSESSIELSDGTFIGESAGGVFYAGTVELQATGVELASGTYIGTSQDDAIFSTSCAEIVMTATPPLPGDTCLEIVLGVNVDTQAIMHPITIQAVEIRLPTVQETPEIGVYTVGGESYFRASEAPLVGIAETFNYTIIKKDGIGETKQRADIINTGNTTQIDGCKIDLDDTAQNYLKLLELVGRLEGLPIKIYEYEGSITDSDAISKTTVFTGTIEEIKWNESYFSLTCNSSLQRKRRANISTTITSGPGGNRFYADSGIDGSIVPITFGRSSPLTGSHFLALQTNARSSSLQAQDIAIYGSFGVYPPDMSLFPAIDTYVKIYFKSSGYVNMDSGTYLRSVRYTSVDHTFYIMSYSIDNSERSAIFLVGAQGAELPDPAMLLETNQELKDPLRPSRIYTVDRYEQVMFVRFGSFSTTAFDSTSAEQMVGRWIKFKESSEDSPNVGLFRKIESVFYPQENQDTDHWRGACFLSFDNYWPSGVFAGGWVELYEIENQYEIDTWPCIGATPDNDTDSSFYAELDGEAVNIPKNSVEIDAGDSDNNKIAINALLFKDELTTVLGYKVISIPSFDLCKSSTLSVWKNTVDTTYHLYNKFADGLYLDHNPNDSPLLSDYYTPGLLPGVYDLYYNTSFDRAIQFKGPEHTRFNDKVVIFAYVFKLPEIDESEKYSAMYLGVKMNCNEIDKTVLGGVKIMTRAFYEGKVKHILGGGDNSDIVGTAGGVTGTMTILDTIPDFAYIQNKDDANKHFYLKPSDNGLGYFPVYTGVDSLEIGVESLSAYKAIEECLLVVPVTINSYSRANPPTVGISEICLILEKEIDIAEGIFV